MSGPLHTLRRVAGVVVLVLAVTLGTTIGLVAGFAGGKVDGDKLSWALDITVPMPTVTTFTITARMMIAISVRTSTGFLGSAAAAASRTPAGHPEGYLEGFANLYKNFVNHVRAFETGAPANPLDMDYPTIEDGVAGMAFIEACVKSSKANGKWTKL